jgi:phosphoadenosine phosphosulfate reductase
MLVAFSGGKDSLVVMDLCLRTFKHVSGFFMSFIPGLDCVEYEIDRARKKHGIEIRVYPHWVTRNNIVNGIYTPSWFENDYLPEWKLADIYAMAMLDANIDQIATGAKRSDSTWRRRFMTTFHPDAVINPIAGWHKYDVVGYLRGQGIPLPPSSGLSATGIDLSVPSLLWLHDTYPEDFRRVCDVFPFAEAVVYRRKFYSLATEL